MEQTWALPGVSKSEADQPPAAPPPRPPRLGRWLTFLVGLVAVAAIAAASWVYVETRREIVRISTDIAQIRLTLELFRQQPGAAGSTTTDARLLDLSNRLAIIEENWRVASPAPAASALPALPSTAASASAGPQADCMPQDTLFLVSAGDSYAICGTPATVSVASVDIGYVTLQDATIIAAGGNGPLVGTECILAVTSSGANDMTGYAELRVTC